MLLLNGYPNQTDIVLNGLTQRIRLNGKLQYTDNGGVSLSGYPAPEYIFSEELIMNGTACEPGPGTRTVVDTETCLSIIPEFGAALDDHTGVTTTTGTHRCSFADSYSWIDFPTGFSFSPFAASGKMVILYDAAGVPAWGYIGAAGTGETLGSELVTNGDFSSATGWTGTEWTIFGGKATCVTTTARSLSRSVSLSIGRLYKSTMDVDSVSGGLIGCFLDASYPLYIHQLGSSTGTRTAYAVSRRTESDVTFGPYAQTGVTAQVDNVTLKEVLTPAATGAWVFRDAALTTNGWHIPTAFNRNSSSYTFYIYEPLSNRGKLFFQGGKATPANGDPGLWRTEAITRAAGIICASKIMAKNVSTAQIFCGCDDNKAGTLSANSLAISGAALKAVDSGTVFPSVLVPINDTDLVIAVILRATGAYFFAKLGTGYWELLWHTTTNAVATLYAGLSNYSMVGFADFIRIPNTRWLPAPLLSDSFAAADATSNNGRRQTAWGTWRQAA